MAFAEQAGLSLGFAPDARCGGRIGLAGSMTEGIALRRLLEGSACEASRPDARTVVIRARPAQPAPSRAALALEAPSHIPATQVADVVVTAEKRETLLSSAASGLTAIPGGELAGQGVGDTGELSLLAAGVTVTNLGPGRNKILLRGLSDGPLTGHTQSTVGIYFGEMRLAYNAPDPDLPFVDVARVEVMRGPQGSLYGAGSVGGVIHIVPNAPDPLERSAWVEGGLATTAHGAASNEGHLILNQPLLDRRAAVRFVAWSETAGGYIDDTARGLHDVDRTRRRGVRLAGLWRPADDVTLEATIIDQSIVTRDAHYAQPSVGPLARAAAVAEPHDNDFLAASVTAHWSPAWGRLTATLSALDHDVISTYAAAGAPASLTVAGTRPERFVDENEIRGVVSEARLASTGSGRVQWIVGGFYAFGQQRLDGSLTAQSGAQGYQEIRRDRLSEAAAFGEISYDVTRQVTVTAGGRVFGSRLSSVSDMSVGAPLRHLQGRATNSGFAPKVRVAWRPSPRLTVYASAVEGYRTAGFNSGGSPDQVFSPNPGEPQPLRRYGSDELWSYEAGVRWRSQGGRLALRAAVFKADWTDIQADLILPSGLPFTANLGDGRSRGVELEATYQTGGLRLSGNLVAEERELIRLAPGLAGRADSSLPGVPGLSYAVAASWRRPFIGRWDLDMSASYNHVGRSRLTFDAVTSPGMGDYGDLRLAADLRGDRFSVGLAVDNVLDDRGDTLAFGNPFSFRRDLQTTPQRPRTIRIRASQTF